MRRGPSMICKDGPHGSCQVLWNHMKKIRTLKKMKPPPTFNRWSNSKNCQATKTFSRKGFSSRAAIALPLSERWLWKLRKLKNSKTQLALTADASNMSMVCILSKARSPPASCHSWSFEKRPGTCTLQYWLIHQRSQLVLYGCLCTLTGMWLLRGNLAQPRPAVEAMLARNRGSVWIGFPSDLWPPGTPNNQFQQKKMVKQPFPM